MQEFQPQENVELLNVYSLNSQLKFKDTLVGGLSSCFYSEKEKILYALSDDRSAKSPARIYKLISSADQKSFELSDVILLKDKTQKTFTQGSIDGEALVISDQVLYVTDEGEREKNAILRQPRILKFDLLGNYLSQIDLPAQFQFQGDGKNKKGPRDNRTLESLTLFENKLTLIFEGPFSDHKKASYKKSLPLHLLNFDLKTEKLVDDGFYYISPVNELTKGQKLGKADHGVAELRALGRDHFLVLERSYLEEINQNFVRVFELKNNKKKLWLDLDQVRSSFPAAEQKLDNIEAMCFGPTLADGKKSLIFISDNNFSDKQRTLFIIFKVL